MADNTAEEIAEMKVIANDPANKPKVIKAYQALITDNGGIRLSPQLAAGKFYQRGMGAAGGLLSSEEGLNKALEGDFVGAVQAAGKEMVIGEAIGQVVQKVAPHANKIMPTITSGVAKIMPGLMKLSGAGAAIQAGATDWNMDGTKCYP